MLEYQDREIVKEIDSEEFLTMPMIDEWADGIPIFEDSNAECPEWKETPTLQLDLSTYGYGVINVKNESDRGSNPTGTIKDRAAWELATLYRDMGRALSLKRRAGIISCDEIEGIHVPRISLITSGNAGNAIARCFEKYELPPPKFILSNSLCPGNIEALSRLRADIYVVDLHERSLSAEGIRLLSNNKYGIDITSSRSIRPEVVFYDWHVHEVFNQEPDEIYVPYGSGRLMENYLAWQNISLGNEINGRRDTRLKAKTSSVIGSSIIGAEPESQNSIADKLPAKFRPFLIFDDSDINAIRDFAFTGRGTGIYKVSEDRILEAFSILCAEGIDAEPSGAASLALYLDRFARGLVDKRSKVVVVNTGKGDLLSQSR